MMFIIEIIYTAPLDVIDAAMKEHMIFLKKYYSKEIFLISGRKEPRKGGIIIASGNDKKQINHGSEQQKVLKILFKKIIFVSDTIFFEFLFFRGDVIKIFYDEIIF